MESLTCSSWQPNPCERTALKPNIPFLLQSEESNSGFPVAQVAENSYNLQNIYNC